MEKPGFGVRDSGKQELDQEMLEGAVQMLASGPQIDTENQMTLSIYCRGGRELDTTPTRGQSGPGQ